MDNLLNLLFRAASVEPRYDEDVCITAGRASLACTACHDACPHDAIRIGRRVEIDPVECSGCGLCVHACPSEALDPRVSYQAGAPVKCSRVAGSAQTVHCLGRLRASDLLRLLGSKDRLLLARADCAACPIGTAAVAAALEQAREEALAMAALHDREVEIEVEERERLDHGREADAVSRRELLRGGWRALQERAGDALAPLDPGDDEPGLPLEMQRRYRVIAAAGPEPETMVPWTLPRVSDQCIMCPSCTRACPTDAISRIFEDDGVAVLRLDPDRCMGCGACADACPVGAIEMDDGVTWGELSGGRRDAFRRDPASSLDGSVAR